MRARLVVRSRTWNASSESPYGDELTWRSRMPSIGSIRISPGASWEVESGGGCCRREFRVRRSRGGPRIQVQGAYRCGDSCGERVPVSRSSAARTQKSSAFTPRVQPIASRRWSRSGRGCIGASAPSRPPWRVGSSCVTIMAPITCPAISRPRSNVWASKLRRPSCANPRATASPSASSEP